MTRRKFGQFEATFNARTGIGAMLWRGVVINAVESGEAAKRLAEFWAADAGVSLRSSQAAEAMVWVHRQFLGGANDGE